MNPTFYHLVFIGMFVAFAIIRVAYRRLAARTSGKIELRESNLHVGLRVGFALAYALLLLAYIVRPDLLAWAQLPLPEWVRWVGIILGLASLLAILWVHWALGSNFSTTLHIREGHTLVTHGPYRWVRHPMYTALLSYLLAMFLLTGNWLVAGPPILALLLVVATRLNKEEAAMTEKFGAQYSAYIKRTGRFLPRLGA